MRTIRLKNAKGKWLDLTNNPSKFFLHSLTGFGFEAASKYNRLGNQYMLIDRTVSQLTPSGVLSIASYELFEEFAKFIQAQPLTIEYTAADTYTLDCYVKSLEKSELTSGGKLECAIEFEAIGRMAKNIFRRADYEGLTGKGYPYSYPFTYESGASGKFEIDSDSLLPSPVCLTFVGPVENPAWAHYINDKVCCTGKVNCSIPEGHRLVVSNIGAYRIQETDNEGTVIRDRYQDSDFSTTRFVSLGFGTNRVYFTHAGANNVNIILEGQIYYETI